MNSKESFVKLSFLERMPEICVTFLFFLERSSWIHGCEKFNFKKNLNFLKITSGDIPEMLGRTAID